MVSKISPAPSSCENRLLSELAPAQTAWILQALVLHFKPKHCPLPPSPWLFSVQLLVFNSPCHDGKCQTPAVLPKPLGEAWLHLVLINLESSSSKTLSLTTALPGQPWLKTAAEEGKRKGGKIGKRLCTHRGRFWRSIQRVRHTLMRAGAFCTVTARLINSL